MSVRVQGDDTAGWTVADDSGWLPGVYDKPETALRARPLTGIPGFDEVAARINRDEVRLITAEDIHEISAQVLALLCAFPEEPS